MKEDIIKLCHKAIFTLILITAATARLFFLPFTSEFFEFNKFSLFLIITVLSTAAWAIRMVLQKRFSFTKTPLDIPLIVFVGVLFIASISSIDQHISLFGTNRNIWPSFFSTLTLAIFYFTGISNLKSKKEAMTILTVLTAATTIAAALATLAYFGIFLPFDFTKIRSFNTLGSTNNLALLEAIILPLAISLIAFSRERLFRSFSAACAILLFSSLLLTNYPSAYFGLIAGALIILLAIVKTKITRSNRLTLALVAVIFTLITALRFFPPLSALTIEKLITNVPEDTTQKLEIPKNLTLPQRTGWDIAASTIAKRPLFGSGPGTFQFVYTQLKPRGINATSLWAVRFEKSSSEFTELVATTGIIGILAFLLLWVTIVRFVWGLIFKSFNSTTYLPAASAIICAIAISFFATFSISITFIVFLLIISLVTLAKTQDEKHVGEMTVEVATLRNSFNWLPAGDKFASLKTVPGDTSAKKSQALPIVFLLVVLITSFFALNFQLKAWRAEYAYRQALLAATRNDGNKTIELLQQAIKINPFIDTYHRALSQTALAAALNLNQKTNLTADERNLVGQLAQVAIEQAKIASGYQILPLRLPGISATNAANWEALSAAYQTIMGPSGTDANAVHAINTLSQALSLDPESPILHDQLGILHQRLKNLDSAQRKFEDAIVTKGDYGLAHYHLANLLIARNGDVPRIVNELTAAKKTLPKEHQAIAEIDKNLEIYNKKLEELQKETANQNQTQEPNASPTPTPTQLPGGKSQASPKPSITPIPTTEPAPSPSL